MGVLKRMAQAMVEAHDERERVRAQQQRDRQKQIKAQAKKDYYTALRVTGLEDSQALRNLFDWGRESAFDEALRMMRER